MSTELSGRNYTRGAWLAIGLGSLVATVLGAVAASGQGTAEALGESAARSVWICTAVLPVMWLIYGRLHPWTPMPEDEEEIGVEVGGAVGNAVIGAIGALFLIHLLPIQLGYILAGLEVMETFEAVRASVGWLSMVVCVLVSAVASGVSLWVTPKPG